MRGKTVKDRLIKIVQVKQNKQSLCGKIPAGLLPPLQLVTADPWRDALLGLLKHDNKGWEQNTASGASKCSTNEARLLCNLTNKVSRTAEEHQSSFTYRDKSPGNLGEEQKRDKDPRHRGPPHQREREHSHSPTGGAACSENKRGDRTRITCPPMVPLTNSMVLSSSSAAVGDAPTFVRPPANEQVCDTVNYSKYESKLYESVEQKVTYGTELCFLH